MQSVLWFLSRQFRRRDRLSMANIVFERRRESNRHGSRLAGAAYFAASWKGLLVPSVHSSIRPLLGTSRPRVRIRMRMHLVYNLRTQFLSAPLRPLGFGHIFRTNYVQAYTIHNSRQTRHELAYPFPFREEIICHFPLGLYIL